MQRKQVLDGLTEKNAPDVVQTACAEALLQVFRHLPLLGFILRSTDTRNSFEVFGPLLRLARQVLGPDINLVLSSEWNFSPHVLSDIAEVPDFVLLGLPATEANNPLLIPLAGHELGHTAWQKRKLTSAFSPKIQKSILDAISANPSDYTEVFGGLPHDLFASANISPAFQWALRQAEETFCDCMGVRLFFGSYFHAFAYLVAPGVTAQRSVHYPNTRRRISNMIQAATKFGIEYPHAYDGLFIDQAEPPDRRTKYLLSLADAVAQALVGDMIARVEQIATGAHVPSYSIAKIEAAMRSFRLMIPATEIGDLANLLSAGWRAYHDTSLWNGPLGIDRSDTLNELLLKSVEVLEIEARVKGNKP